MKSLSLSAPHIVALVGIPGAGKTEFAVQFSETFSAPLISHHYLQPLTTDTEAIETITRELLREVTKTKQTIIFDGATEQRTERQELTKIAKACGYKILFVWVQTDPHIAQKRVEKQITFSQYEDLFNRFSPPHESEPFVVISGRHTYNTQARTLLRRLTSPTPEPTARQPIAQPAGQRRPVRHNRVQ